MNVSLLVSLPNFDELLPLFNMSAPIYTCTVTLMCCLHSVKAIVIRKCLGYMVWTFKTSRNLTLSVLLQKYWTQYVFWKVLNNLQSYSLIYQLYGSPKYWKAILVRLVFIWLSVIISRITNNYLCVKIILLCKLETNNSYNVVIFTHI